MSDKDELERQDFEAWFKPKKIAMQKRGISTIRIVRLYQRQWEAWQASRAAIEIDIDWPEANDDHWKDGEEGAYARGYEDGKDLTAIKVRQGLATAGIKVKP